VLLCLFAFVFIVASYTVVGAQEGSEYEVEIEENGNWSFGVDTEYYKSLNGKSVWFAFYQKQGNEYRAFLGGRLNYGGPSETVAFELNANTHYKTGSNQWSREILMGMTEETSLEESGDLHIELSHTAGSDRMDVCLSLNGKTLFQNYVDGNTEFFYPSNESLAEHLDADVFDSEIKILVRYSFGSGESVRLHNVRLTLGEETQVGISGPYTFSIENGTATLISVKKEIEGALSIPERLDGYKLVAIGERAFYNCERITSLTIPDTVERIGKAAFMECERLRSVYLPDSLEVISEQAFSDCYMLSEVRLPSGLERIEKMGFFLCTRLEVLELPETLEYIGESAFGSCSSLCSLVIPKSVKEIRECCFSECVNLVAMRIPNSVKKMGASVFSGCTLLESVVLPESLGCIGESFFSGCELLKSVNIPHGVTDLGKSAFCNCSSLRTVDLPEGIERIGAFAFYNCSSLERIEFPATLVSVGERAFGKCISAKKLDIPETLESVGEYAFESCSFEEITIRSGYVISSLIEASSCGAVLGNAKSITVANLPELFSPYFSFRFACRTATADGELLFCKAAHVFAEALEYDGQAHWQICTDCSMEKDRAEHSYTDGVGKCSVCDYIFVPITTVPITTVPITTVPITTVPTTSEPDSLEDAEASVTQAPSGSSQTTESGINPSNEQQNGPFAKKLAAILSDAGVRTLFVLAALSLVFSLAFLFIYRKI